MNEVYSSHRHVVKSLSAHIEESDSNEGRVTILDTKDARVVAEDNSTMEERNLWSMIDRVSDQICTIKWEVSSFGTTHLRLTFHQNSVDSDFTLNPASPTAVGAEQATNPTELSDELRTALKPLEDEGAIFTFAEVSAASMASGGHFTDFEFEYSIDGLNL